MMRSGIRRGVFAGWVLAIFTGPVAGLAAAEDMEPQAAVQAPLAERSLLLDVAMRSGGGFVAVGERGHVLLSEDGRTWAQADQVPVRSTLTRVTSFGRELWAVGHDSAIIFSADGGRRWVLQHFEPEASEPLLDVMFISATEGFAVGAYGRFMSTRDGGRTWQLERLADRVVDEDIDWEAIAREQGGYDTLPDGYEFPGGSSPLDMLDKGCYEFQECHLNALIDLGEGRLMLAAERGYGFRSEDRGETWTAFRFPYSGSMFGLAELGPCVVAFGLRGHVQRSCDFARRWEDLTAPGQQNLLDSTAVAGGVVIVGAGATRIYLPESGALRMEMDRLGSDYAGVTSAPDGLILVGEDGVRHEAR